MKIIRALFFAGAALALGGCDNPASPPAAAARPLTAAVGFRHTPEDSGGIFFDLERWTGYGSGTEHWSLAVVEKGTVYFAVNKGEAQEVTPGGPDGDRALAAPPGTEADGAVAGPALALFTVDTSDILAGGTRRFTLTVGEAEKESRTVTVDLEVEADLSREIGVFAVDPAGGMVRITAENAEDYAHGGYGEEKSHWFAESGSVDFASVDSLLRALMWVDRYALPGTEGAWREYLIRMEKDEAIPKVALTCTHSKGIELIQTPWVKIRLRGYGGERRITKDRTGLSTYRSSGNASTESLINLGNMQSTMNPIALQLERDITIDAGDGEDPLFPSSESNGTREMIFVGERGVFILGEGSKLTRYNNGSSTSLSLIMSYGSTEMNGGAITDCTIGGNWFPISGNFIYRSGIFSGNNFDSPAFTEG